MGDTLHSASQISSNDSSNFHLWDKGQLVVILSQTKLARNSTFLVGGAKNDTLNALTKLLLKKSLVV